MKYLLLLLSLCLLSIGCDGTGTKKSQAANYDAQAEAAIAIGNAALLDQPPAALKPITIVTPAAPITPDVRPLGPPVTLAVYRPNQPAEVETALAPACDATSCPAGSCSSGACASGACASGSCLSGGPVRNVVGGMLDRRPMRRLGAAILERRPVRRILGAPFRLFGACRSGGCG